MLTKKQRDLLVFIHERLASGDVAPSFDEMKDALDLKSKSGVHRLVNALVERGFLERLPNRARALEVRRLPDGYMVPPAPAKPDMAASQPESAVIRDLVKYKADLDRRMMMQVPLLGKIAAGTPIEALQHEGQFFDMPASLMGKGDHYALVIEGDSMIGAGIHDQDIVLIKRTDHALDGDIVVALVDEQEATLKRLRRRGAHIDLIPENPDYTTKTYESGRVRVQGQLAGLYRQYH